MAYISVTRLRPRGLRFLPTILRHASQSRKQLRTAKGFLGGYLASSRGMVLWTVTVWVDESAMRTFRNEKAHLRAMPDLIRTCAEASYVSWTSNVDTVPPPVEAAERLQLGHTSKLRFPSVAHASGDPWPDRRVPRKGPFLPPVDPTSRRRRRRRDTN